MKEYLLISDAAKEVCVESHVLRYWEEELHLPIKRNELGHRYYTPEDVERFKQIKGMKERGLQLKAIKIILKDGKLNILDEEKTSDMAIDIVDNKTYKITETEEKQPMKVTDATEVSREEKVRKLQWVLQQMMKEALVENNRELVREVKESVVKELDYQFRNQEEREEERDKLLAERSEQYYQKMDELLRTKNKKTAFKKGKEIPKEEAGKDNELPMREKQTKDKKKRHFIF